jgi:Radical SAM superfamily/4Fe-4S single cluster domain
MIYEFHGGRIHTQGIEYSAAYHCNLRCSGCSHLSPYLRRKFPPLESFAADVTALAGAMHARDFRLVGGEPLLNPEITRFVQVAKQSGIADTIMVTTNGLLLGRMDDAFWDAVDFVSVTLYPGHSPSEQSLKIIEGRAKESGTRLRLFPNPVFRTTVVSRPHRKDWITDTIYHTCKNVHLYHCHMLHEGTLYKCAVPPFLPEYLGRMERSDYEPERDGFDIHAAGDLYEELKRYLTSNRTLDACCWCLGFVGKFQGNHQMNREALEDPALQGIRREKDIDWYKFIKEWARYRYRRLLERTTSKPRW